MLGCWRRGVARSIRCRTQRLLICQRYAALPLCCDLSCVKQWQWYVCTVEQLVMAYSKDKEALKEHLDTLKKNFEAAPTCE